MTNILLIAVRNLRNNELCKLAGFTVSGVEFANGDKDFNIIDAYGAELDAARMQYILPRITFDTEDDFPGTKEFFVKKIKPEGKLLTGSDSPAGYSYSHTLEAQPGRKGEKTTLSPTAPWKGERAPRAVIRTKAMCVTGRENRRENTIVRLG